MNGKSLTELANQYGSDKGTIGPTAKWSAHNYTDVYEAYLERYRNDPVTMIEIGLGVSGKAWNSFIVRGRNSGGASPKMWHDYFPNARIYGIDVNECAYLDNERVRTFVADQGNTADLERVMQAVGNVEFDFIFDDGSHRPDHQQISLGYFFKKLKPGGLYFIEDLARNGCGDGKSGRSDSPDVLNTRRVLKHFRERGEFPQPHAIGDPDYLRDTIAAVNFHVPRMWVTATFKPRLRRPLGRLNRFLPDSETLCAIRKK